MSTSGGFRELESVTRSHSPATLTFRCKEFRLIRCLLRLLSLWRPRSAGVLEKYIYPAIVNLLLLSAGLVRNSIQATTKPNILSIQTIYIIHELGIWLGHFLGNVYFRSRDLETNVLPEALPLSKARNSLKRMLKYLNFATIASLSLFSIVLCTLFVFSKFSHHGKNRFSSELPHVHGTVDHVLYVLVIIQIVYNLGIGLALSWTMALLYVCFASRLKALEGVYLTWKKPTVDAVYLFQQVYSRPVKRSWKRISWWFLVHNIIVLAVPLYGYELAQALCGEEYQSKHLLQFICYLVFVLTVWLTPIVMAEQIKRREKKFMERVNDFCSGVLQEVKDDRLSRAASLDGNRDRRSGRRALDSSASEGELDVETYMFATRERAARFSTLFEGENCLGLVSRGYTFQLNLALVSLFAGIVSFLVELNRNDKLQWVNIYRSVVNTSREMNNTII